MRAAVLMVALVLGLVGSSTAAAHQTGQATFVVHIKPDARQVDTLLTCPMPDVAHAAGIGTGPDGTFDVGEVVKAWNTLGFYLDPHIDVSNDGRRCNAIEHRLSPSSDPGSFWFLKAFECDAPLGEVVVKNDAMTETVGGYRHLGRIQLGDVVHPTVFTAATPTFAVGVAEGAAAPGADASLAETIARFLREGFVHILIGWDHVLFVLALVLLTQRLRELLVIVTAFTVAHSLTLALAALDVVRVPAAVVEPIIALSIAWVAVEAALERREARRAYVATFLLGLVHGFGFSYVLRDEVGLPTDALIPALLSFNVGVELGQIAIVAAFYPLRAYARGKSWERRAVLVMAGLIGLLAMYWFVERTLL